MNTPSYPYDPWFVHETMQEKLTFAESERLVRRALRTSQARTPMLYPVRRRLGLQFVALGTALQGSAPNSNGRAAQAGLTPPRPE
jgi:hypothetical protein